MDLATHCEQLDDLPGALELYEKAEPMDKTCLFLHQLEDLPAALVALQSTGRLDGLPPASEKTWPLLMGFAGIHKRLENFSLAAAEYGFAKVFACRQDEKAATLYETGRMHLLQDEDTLALKFFKQALRKTTRSVRSDHVMVALVKDGIADITFRQGNYEQALLEYTDVLRMTQVATGVENPRGFSIHTSIAQCHLKLGNNAKAREHLVIATRIHTTYQNPVAD